MKFRKRLLRLFVSVLTLYLLAVVISFVASGCASDPHPLSAKLPHDPPHLRVMTYNVNYDTPPEQTASAIAKADADIIFLQESTSAWEAYARTHLSDRYKSILFHNEEYAGGMAILSRYPVTELFYEMPPAGWMHGWGVKISTDSGEMQLLNVHLRPPAAGSSKLSYINYFKLSTVHPQEIEHLYNRFDRTSNSTPLIVMGDFNESDDGAAMQFLKARGLIDALPPFDSHSKTWHGTALGISLSERCDHILYSPQFKCIDAAVLREGKSDHLPVIAILERQP